jgi:dTMP kinase
MVVSNVHFNRVVVIEGGDGTGKDYQAEQIREVLVARGLDSRNVRIDHEPTDGPIGQEIYKILQGKLPKPSAFEMQKLYDKDRKVHVKNMQEWLENHPRGVIICTRYFYSTIAYGVADGISWEEMMKLTSWTPRPGILIYLDVHPRIAAKRREQRGLPPDHFETLKFQERVCVAYRALPDHGFFEMRLVDGSGEKHQVTKLILAQIMHVLRDAGVPLP